MLTLFARVEPPDASHWLRPFEHGKFEMIRTILVALALASVCAPAFAQQNDGTDLMARTLADTPSKDDDDGTTMRRLLGAKLASARDKRGDINLECKTQVTDTLLYDGHPAHQDSGQQTHAISLDADRTFSDVTEETGAVRTGAYIVTQKRYLLQYRSGDGVVSGSGFIDREDGDISATVSQALTAPQTMNNTIHGDCNPEAANPKF